MLQTVYHVPHETAGGIPVFGFGLLLGVWVLLSLGLLLWLGRRQGFNADTWINVSLLLVVGSIISWLLPALSEARGLPIRGYGVMVVLAVAVATGLSAWRARRVGLDPDMILSLAFWMFVPGIICARTFYVVEYWEQYRQPGQNFSALLVAVINLAQGGLVIYGGFIGGMLGLLAFARRYRVPLLALCDLMAPGIALAMAIGRIGCLMNGCCFGGSCELPWAVTFPSDSPAHFHQIEHGHTFIYGLKIGEDSQGRPIIKEVELGSPAQWAGLRAGQQITGINRRLVRTVRGAAAALLDANKISIVTEGGGYTGPRTIEVRPTASPPVSMDANREHRRNVTEGRSFVHGLKITGDSQGPLIAEVEPDSPAEREGLKRKQRIASINGRPRETVLGAVAVLLDASTISIATGTGEDSKVSRWNLPAPPSQSRPVASVHPTQVYSSINALLLCLLLLAYDPFRRRDGQLFALLVFVYAISRFLLEYIRDDENKVFNTGLTISQNVSLALLLVTIGLWIYLLRRPARKAFG